MGSVDIPPFMREAMKQKVQANKSDIPPFLQKKNDGESGVIVSEEVLQPISLDPVSNSDNGLPNTIVDTSPSKSSSLLEKSVSAFKLRPIQSKINPDGTANFKNSSKLYNEADEAEISNLTNKYKPATIQGIYNVTDIVNKELGIPNQVSAEVSLNPNSLKLKEISAIENSIKTKIFEKQLALNRTGEASMESGQRNSLTPEEDNELKNLTSIRNKISAEMAVKSSEEADVIVRTGQGNLLDKFVTRAKIAMGDISGSLELGQETEDRISKLPQGFFTGLSYFKNAEPVVFERLTNAITNGLPISESQIAQVTAEGLAIEQAKLERQVNLKEITPEDFNKQINEIQKNKVDNLLNNKETLRAALSNGIAEDLDAKERANQGDFKDVALGALGVGFRWNYDDNEIKASAEKWAVDHGLDPSNPNVQEAIKYLQDNEGAMILDNSIAKSGIVREFGKGLAEPIRGISSSIESLSKDAYSVYAEGQSQGNVNVSEQRLKIDDTGWRGVVNDVTKGVGQFATQAAIAIGTSGLIGTVAEGLQGLSLSSRAAEIVASEVGTSINVAKDFAATLTTSFAQVYDSNLKTALNYTSDNQIAKNAAFINSTIEGLSENILSPIDIVKGIKIFKTPSAQEGLIKVLSEKNILSNPSALNNFLRSTLNVGLGTAKVAGTEIAEEFVTQIADFTTNAFLNPNSKSFQDRDLVNELANTAYQTGLSMAIPAIANGIGAGNVNSFAKGSLMIAAQNRQSLIDNLTEKLADKTISEDEYNRKVSIINAAAKANETLPLKADNTPLNSDEKADYVFSRVSEGVMQKKMEESNDEAEKQIFQAKIKEQQDFRTQLLTTNDNAAISTENGNTGNNETVIEGNDGNISTGSNDIAGGLGSQINEGNVTAEAVVEADKTSSKEDQISVGEMIDKVGSYKGQRGLFYQDGQTVVFKVEGKNKEYEIGNIDEVGNNGISDFGIENEDTVVSFDDAGNVAVRGISYVNNFSDPLQAINRDADGNIVSVNLETADGKKRAFRGNIAEDIAYQINLKQITQDNETATRFETFLSEDATAQQEINDNNERVSAATTQTTDTPNEQIQREKITPVNNETNQQANTENQQSNVQAEATQPSNTAANQNAQSPEAISRAKEIAGKADIKGFTSSIIKDAALNDKPAFLEYLQNISEQAQDPNSVAQAVSTYGQELVDIANELNPKNGTTSSTVNEPVSTDKKQSTGQGTETPISGTTTGDNGGGATATTSVSDESGDSGTGITLEQTAEIRGEFGLPEYGKGPQTFAAWDAEAKKRIENGEMPALIQKLKKGEPPTEVEQRMMGQYIANLEKIASETQKDADIKKLYDAIKLSDSIGGSEIGRSLVARRGIFLPDDSLAGFFIAEMEASQVEVLTDEQKAVAEKECNDIIAATEKYKSDLEELAKANAKKKATENVKKAVGSQSKTKKTAEDYKKERDSIVESMRKKLAKSRGELNVVPIPYLKELIIIAPDVARMVKNYADQGLTKLSEIVDNIHDILKDNINGITKEDVNDLIAGTYNEPAKTKTELQIQRQDLRTEAKLIKKLSDLEKEVEPKTPTQKKERNQAIKKLQDEIKEFNKKQREADKFYPEETLPDAKKLLSLKNKNEKEIAAIQAEIDKGNFKTPEKNKPLLEDNNLKSTFPDLYKKAKQSKDNLIKVKQDREIRLLKEEYANRTKWQKRRDAALEVLNVPRTIMSSIDFSAPLRQGVVPTISHPILASKAFVEMFRQAVSQKRFDRWFFDLRQDPDFTIMEKSGLYVADPHDLKLSAKEEQFMNNLAEKIPLIGRLIKGSERAYVSYLNKMRVDLFKQGEDVLISRGMTLENSPEAYKALGSWVNNSTGRGGLGKAETMAPILNSVFFSPRLIASRLNLLNPIYYAKLPKNVRNMALADMSKFVIFGLSVLSLAAIFGDDDDDEGISVETDIRSTDFGKIKIGDTRYDIWGGFQQYVRVIGQIFSGQSKSQSGNIREIDGSGRFGEDRTDLVGRFFRGKLAPVPATLVDLFSGRTIMGDKIVYQFGGEKLFEYGDTPGKKEITITDEISKILLPLVVSDVSEAIKNEGIKSLGTVWLPATFGVGVQNYQSK